MNKISKKIVALATMAAFVLTLVPAAAFAAEPTQSGDPNYSTVKTVYADPEVAVGEDVVLEASVYEKDNKTPSTIQPVRVWAEDSEGNVTKSVEFYSTDANGDKTGSAWPVNDGGVVDTPSGAITNGQKFIATFSVPGTYTVHVGQVQTQPNDKPEIVEVNYVDGYDTITVTGPAVDSIGIWDAVNSDMVDFGDDGVGELNLVGDKSFVANGTDKYTVTGWVYDKAGNPLGDKEVTISSGRSDILVLTGDAADGTVTTKKDGSFTFTFTMNDNRNVPITITSGDATVTLRILKETTNPYDIDTVQDGGYVLAGTDSHFNDRLDADFSEAVQFGISTIDGDAITSDLSATEPAANGDGGTAVGARHPEFLDVTSKPEKSTLSSWDLVLVQGIDGTYTLEYQDTDANAEKDLIPGEYTVRVSLLSGDYADASFTVAKFGTVQDIVLDMDAYDNSTNRKINITDEVTLGQTVNINAKYVDENGLKINATSADIDLGAYGKAVTDVNYGADKAYFSTKPDVAANESLLGTVITVTGYSQKYKAYVEQELTVVDSYNAFTLEFDPTEGAVNEDNDVTVKVVKEDGSLSQVDGELQAYVADQSNEDAVVSVEAGDTVKDGKGKLTVYASEPTTVDIVVAVKDDSNQGLYAATLEYTVGAEQILAHHNVVMTIGSSEYVVDKQLFTMDAAPYVDSNWRTMVPIRALAEAFDATVTYDNDARTVTIEYNEQTIVMTIDSATYTVNGVEGEMDTEAVINSADDRTYVPIRFAAEAMGFTVTALYDENSSTASVVFQS